MASFTPEQFDALMKKLTEVGATAGAQAARDVVAGGTAQSSTSPGAAALVGQVPPCQLGKNKVKRFKKWRDWMRDADNKMTFLKITEPAQKISFIRSCAGAELTEFWEKEARIRFSPVPADAVNNVPAQEAHTFPQILSETKAALLKYINRDRAIIDLLRLEQGARNFTDFLSEVEDAEYLCRVEEQPITSADLQRMSLIAGIKDRTLAEKALTEGYTLKQLITAAINRESSRANVEAMQARPATSVSTIESREYTELKEQMCEISDKLSSVMRVNSSGKYSRRYKAVDKSRKLKPDCARCTYSHEKGQCPAERPGRSCHKCGNEGHFAGSSMCTVKTKGATARRVEYETQSSDSEYDSEVDAVSRVERVWPGVAPGTTATNSLYCLNAQSAGVSGSKRKSKRVDLTMGGIKTRLFTDTGSKYSIIPPDTYSDQMGKVVPADCNLRAWGSDTYLDVKGMFQTELVAPSGAKTTTWVYVVSGTRPEPLLGEKDAEALGIITFNPQGRPPRTNEQSHSVCQISIPAKLRKAGFSVAARKPDLDLPGKQGKQEAARIAQVYTGTVLTARTGLMKTRPVKLQYEEGFKPVQPPRYPVPFHYRERLSAHLEKLRTENIIEDVDPAEPVDCILNVTISDKKTPNEIRMNIDARPINQGAKHTKYHVPTPQEVRHELEGATIFTELDMVNGFHQIPLDKSSQIVFRTHEGLHRMKRLFFGPKNSSGIFHHEVKKAFTGVPGCITIHDNVLVYGKGPNAVDDHNKNLLATFKRAKEWGITFKEKQNTICAPEVKWFGRIFSAAGVSADPDKIQVIQEAGPPETIADVKSLLQAAAYNAKFAFDHREDLSYEEATAPLRELLTKDAQFSWNAAREKSYRMILRMLTDKSILTPFVRGRPTHLVTDASPQGIAASLYQTNDAGTWLPIDHISRALSDHEKAWKSQIEWESLAKMWGMTEFRPYLVGSHFTSWGDQKPLVPIYNEPTRPASLRINKHRSKVIDLVYTDKYLAGSKMPADFASRHPAPISKLSAAEREDHMVDDGNDIQVMRVIMADLPPALTTSMIREAAKTDRVYQRLMEAIKLGRKPDDPCVTLSIS